MHLAGRKSFNTRSAKLRVLWWIDIRDMVADGMTKQYGHWPNTRFSLHRCVRNDHAPTATLVLLAGSCRRLTPMLHYILLASLCRRWKLMVHHVLLAGLCRRLMLIFKSCWQAYAADCIAGRSMPHMSRSQVYAADDRIMNVFSRGNSR